MINRVAIVAALTAAAFLGVAVLLAQTDAAAPDVPQPAIIAKGRCLSVRDGDTLQVEIRFVANVRLLECWAPELKDGKPGDDSKNNLKQMAEGKDCIVEVPFTSDNIGRATSMGRILGRVYVDGKDLSAEQVKAGFATEEKR